MAASQMTRCYVAYLDMLGMSAAMTGDDVQAAVDIIVEVFAAVSAHIGSGGVQVETTKVVWISDGLAIVRPICSDEGEDEATAVVRAVSAAQLLLVNAGYLSRGAITVGDLFVDVNLGIIVGPALVEAVQIETRTSMPRVEISPGVLQDFRRFASFYNGPNSQLEKWFLEDQMDGACFVDYCAVTLQSYGMIVKSIWDDVFSTLRTGSSHPSDKVKAKYTWAEAYLTASAGAGSVNVQSAATPQFSRPTIQQ